MIMLLVLVSLYFNDGMPTWSESDGMRMMMLVMMMVMMMMSQDGVLRRSRVLH